MIAENEPMGAPDTSNTFNVRSSDGGETIWFDNCEHTFLLKRRKALLLAAWLVCIAGGDAADFDRILKSIRGR